MKMLAIAASVLLMGLSSAGAQDLVLEVQQSNGFVEALLANLGWRQAVVGRQLPAGAVVTSWLAASATLGYNDSVVTVEQLTHLTVLDVGPAAVRLSLESGGLKVDSGGVVYEIQFRGMVIHIENGSAVLRDGALTAESGRVVVNGARDGPMEVPAGATVFLLSPAEGPVFPASQVGDPPANPH